MMFVVAWCCTMGAWAYDFEADGIYYGITSATDKTVEVVAGDTQYSGDVTVPATVTYNGTTYQITAIGNSAFSGCRRLTSVVLPDGVVLIGENAFGNNSTFSSVTLPQSLTTISDRAFYGCRQMSEILLPDRLMTIGTSAFMSCINLSVVEIPASVSQIGEGAFSNCTNLQEIKVAEGNVHYTALDGVLFDKSGTTLVLYPKGKEGSAYTIPEGVTTINGMAFYGCVNLSSVDMPHGLTSIGNSAFASCTGLVSVTLPDGTVSIGEKAFSGCSNITTVTLPRSVASIGSSAFNSCSGLTSVVIDASTAGGGSVPTGSATIGDSAFYLCKNLVSIDMPTGITSIGKSAFAYCSSLDSISIPEDVTEMGERVFQKCEALTVVTIPQDVSKIGASAFSECGSLQKIHSLASTPPVCGENCFAGVDTALFVYVPKGRVESYKAASEWKNIDYIFAKEVEWSFAEGYFSYQLISPTELTVRISDYNSTAAEVTIPNTVSYKDVTYQIISIYNSKCFGTCADLKKIEVAEGNAYFSSINGVLFDKNGTTLLASPGGKTGGYTIPDGVTAIGSNAFRRSKLDPIVIPHGVTTIGDLAFAECENLSTIVIPESVTTIGRSAFNSSYNPYNPYYLYRIYSLATIPPACGGNCFSGVDKASCTLYVPKGSLEAYKAADEWKNFENIVEEGTISYRVLSAEEKTVEVVAGDTEYIGHVVIPATVVKEGITYRVTGIGSGAFNDCQGLVSVSLPEGILYTGDSFYSTRNSNLQAIYVDEGNELYCSIDGVLFDKNVTRLFAYPAGKYGAYTIPKGVTSIEWYAFEGCSGLTSISLPEGVTYIGNRTFYNCNNLISIVMPEDVVFIGDDAFSGCSSLTSIEIPEGVTSVGRYAFNNCSRLQSIDVGEENAYYASIDGVLFNKNATTLIVCPGGKSGAYTIPEGTNSIEDFAFDGCSNLASIVIPEGVISIGYRAYQECRGLTSISMPETLSSIEDFSFAGCSNLQEIHSLAITPPTCGIYCFLEVDQTTCTLYVPKGTLEAYKAADVWKAFVNIVEEGSSSIEEAGADSAGQAVITACGNGIVVENLPAGTAVTVYTLSGTVVYEGVASGSRTELTLPAGHIYLVKCGQMVTKVAL